MNVYFLVEGTMAEPTVYQSWLNHLVPKLQPVEAYLEATAWHYHLVSIGGKWGNRVTKISRALQEVEEHGNYDYLVVCIDAEENTVAEVNEGLEALLAAPTTTFKRQQTGQQTELIVIVQNRCLETWFLGNRALYPQISPHSQELADFMRYYDASQNDPELMGQETFATHAQFHKRYFWRLFYEQGIKNKRLQLEQAAKPRFLQQLETRVRDEPTHLQSFQTFLAFCQQLNI